MIDRERYTKRYHIGPKMIVLALAVEQRLEVKKVARAYLQEASDDIGETLTLGVLSGDEIAVGENEPGLSSIAAPVRNIDEEVLAAVSVTVPTARVSKDRLQSHFSEKVIQTADKISNSLGYHGWS